MPDRDTERFALHDRADEGAHRRRVAAAEHVQQRFLDRQAHVLLLECQEDFLAEGAAKPGRSHLQRSDEPEPSLDRDHEQVDELR